MRNSGRIQISLELFPLALGREQERGVNPRDIKKIEPGKRKQTSDLDEVQIGRLLERKRISRQPAKQHKTKDLQLLEGLCLKKVPATSYLSMRSPV